MICKGSDAMVRRVCGKIPDGKNNVFINHISCPAGQQMLGRDELETRLPVSPQRADSPSDPAKKHPEP